MPFFEALKTQFESDIEPARAKYSAAVTEMALLRSRFVSDLHSLMDAHEDNLVQSKKALAQLKAAVKAARIELQEILGGL